MWFNLKNDQLKLSIGLKYKYLEFMMAMVVINALITLKAIFITTFFYHKNFLKMFNRPYKRQH